MRNMIVLVAAFACASATGCGGKTKTAPTGAGSDVASGSDMGSGAMNGSDMVGTGSGSAVETKPPPAPPPAPPPPPPKSQEEIAARYQECWGLWNDGKYDEFKGCFAADATSEDPGSGKPAISGVDAIIEDAKAQKNGVPDMKGSLQLVLVNGTHVVGVAVLMGTNTETLKTPMGDIPPSKKKIGVAFAHVAELTDQAVLTKQWSFYDIGTLLSQIGASKMKARKAMTKGWNKTTEVVLAKNDDAEKANLATFDALTDAFNKHDAKALGALIGDKVVWTEVADPADLNKKTLLKNMPAMWKGFSDLTFTVKDKWAAGDYVVAVESFDGTNDGDLPMMKLKKTGKKVSTPFLAIHKFVGGKNTATWIFYQGMDFAMQLGMMPPPAAK